MNESAKVQQTAATGDGNNQRLQQDMSQNQQQIVTSGAMASPGCAVTSTMSSLNQAALQMQQQAQQTPPPQGAQQTQAQTPQAIAPAPSQPHQTSSPMHGSMQQQQHTMVPPNPQQSPHQQHAMAPPTPQPSPQQQQAMGQHNMGPHPGATMQQVQLIQSPQQNPMYLQQVYNTQGQLLMPGNIALHSAGMNQPIQSLPGLASFQFQTKAGGGAAMVPVTCGPTTLGKLPPGHTLLPAAAAAQVIAATGKPFQAGQLTPHLLTTQGKPVLQAGQAGSFPGYTTIPTSTNQTLVISHMGVISSQPNILPANSSATGKQEVPKMMQNAKGQVVQANGVTANKSQGNQGQGGQVVSQPQLITTQAPTAAMLGNQAQLISPIQQFQWQAFGPSIPQGLAWAPGSIPSQALLTTQNPIFIRGTQQDGQMFIQNAPAQAMATHNQMASPAANMAGTQQMQQKPVRQGMEMPANIQPKVAPPQRSLSNILPSQNIRPASSVSTQTNCSPSVASGQVVQKSQAKVRSKPGANRTSPAPGGGTLKADAANQTKPQPMAHPNQIIVNKVMLNNAGCATSVSNQLPPSMQGGMIVTGGDKTMMTASPQMMSKLVPISIQQQMPQSMQQQIHLVPQQSVQPLQQQQQQHKMAMASPGDKPVMPVTAAVMAPVMQAMPGAQLLSNSQLMQQGLVASSQAVQMSQQASLITTMQPPISVPQGLTVAAVPSGASMVSQPTSVHSTNMVPLMTTAAGVHLQQQQQQHREEQVTQMANMMTPPMVANNMHTDTSQQNGVQPMEVTEASEPPNVAKEDKNINGETMENGLDDGKDKGRLKALVKPQVLTHVIEGFVIQEASEPFTINRSGMIQDSPPSRQNHSSDKENQANETCEPPKKRSAIDSQTLPPPKGDLAKCEFCGKVDLRSKFKKSKRFCSISCAKSCSKRMFRPDALEGTGGKKPMLKQDQAKQEWQKNSAKPGDWAPPASVVSGGNRVGDDLPEETNDSGSGPESSLSPSEAPEVPAIDMEDSSASESILPIPSRNNPVKWNVSEVCEFIRLLPGCSDYAEDFAIQEIDGQALMLLKADHLMTAMSMKLGPALKICAKIDQLKNIAAEK